MYGKVPLISISESTTPFSFWYFFITLQLNYIYSYSCKSNGFLNKQCILNTDDFLKTRSIFKFFNYPLSLQNHPSFSNFKRSMINSKYITFVYLTSIRKISELDEPLYLSHTYILGTEWNKNRLIISHLKIKY